MTTTGLRNLAEVELSAPYQEMLAAAGERAPGPRMWRERKLSEARDLLALATVAPRMEVKDLNLEHDLRALVHMRMPVPCRFGREGDLVISHEALLGISYPRQALFESLPGSGFVQALQPMGIYLPTVGAPPIQHVCLADKLPAGTQLRELVLMSYRALTMQDHTLDENDPAGVFRKDAARWWQRNIDKIPLTREPFLEVGDA